MKSTNPFKLREGIIIKGSVCAKSFIYYHINMTLRRGWGRGGNEEEYTIF